MSMTNWADGGSPNSVQPIFILLRHLNSSNEFVENESDRWYLFVPTSSQCQTLCLYSTSERIWKIQITLCISFGSIIWIQTIFITLDACNFINTKYAMKRNFRNERNILRQRRDKTTWREFTIHFDWTNRHFIDVFQFNWIMTWNDPISLEVYRLKKRIFLFLVIQRHFSVYFVCRKCKIGNCCHRNGDSTAILKRKRALFKPKQMNSP